MQMEQRRPVKSALGTSTRAMSLQTMMSLWWSCQGPTAAGRQASRKVHQSASAAIADLQLAAVARPGAPFCHILTGGGLDHPCICV